MLFAVVYRTRENWSEDLQRRSLQLFTQWQPPAGLEFKAHYAHADRRGGLAIVEVSDATVLVEGIEPFSAYYDFEATPVVEMTEAVPVMQRALAWRDSIR